MAMNFKISRSPNGPAIAAVKIVNWVWWDSMSDYNMHKIHNWLWDNTYWKTDACVGQHIVFADEKELTMFLLKWK